MLGGNKHAKVSVKSTIVSLSLWSVLGILQNLLRSTRISTIARRYTDPNPTGKFGMVRKGKAVEENLLTMGKKDVYFFSHNNGKGCFSGGFCSY
jgi:hypothetical protein